MSAKKLKIEYGDSVFALPREALMLTLPSAGAVELKVLLLAASDDSLRSDYENGRLKICRQLDITESAFDRVLKFWDSAGVLSVRDADGDASSPPQTAAEPSEKSRHLRSSTLPTYTEDRAAQVMEAHEEIAGVIEACQQIAERIFTPNEVQSVVGIYDHLGLSDAGYIETLYLYCKSQGKCSPRYVEKVAVSLFDDDIVTTSQLNEYIKRQEDKVNAVAGIRSLIGAGDRALTAKEKKYFECWCIEWGLDLSVVTRAYEVTVDNIGEYKAPYMNKVLENWHNQGLTTIEAVEASLDTYRKNKTEASKSSLDFNEDEYFEAALARSARYLESSKTESDS